MSPQLEQLVTGGVAVAIIAGTFPAESLWRRFNRPRAAPAILPLVPQGAPAPAAAEESAVNPLSYINQNILIPIEKDVEGFFESDNAVSTQLKTSAATIGTALLAQVDPVVGVAEGAVETVIDTALTALGPIGAAAKIPVDVFYSLLAQALNAKINAKLGITGTATPPTNNTGSGS